MIYKDYRRNHVVLPGREDALEAFLKQTYKGLKHKWKNGVSSHSEDALTWSCFDTLSSLPLSKKIAALDEIFEDAYLGHSNFLFKKGSFKEDQIQIHIGKKYTSHTLKKESTEVDASIEVPGKLIFFEAKLYSPVSMASPPEKPYDQIARKLRIGLDSPLRDTREFFFIFLDIAPREILTKRKNKSDALSPSKGFEDKWKSAWLFNYYKFGRNNSLSPLKKALEGIDIAPVQSVAKNMGWLTWSDLFKIVLRGMIPT